MKNNQPKEQPAELLTESPSEVRAEKPEEVSLSPYIRRFLEGRLKTADQKNSILAIIMEVMSEFPQWQGIAELLWSLSETRGQYEHSMHKRLKINAGIEEVNARVKELFPVSQISEPKKQKRKATSKPTPESTEFIKLKEYAVRLQSIAEEQTKLQHETKERRRLISWRKQLLDALRQLGTKDLEKFAVACFCEAWEKRRQGKRVDSQKEILDFLRPLIEGTGSEKELAILWQGVNEISKSEQRYVQRSREKSFQVETEGSVREIRERVLERYEVALQNLQSRMEEALSEKVEEEWKKNLAQSVHQKLSAIQAPHTYWPEYKKWLLFSALLRNISNLSEKEQEFLAVQHWLVLDVKWLDDFESIQKQALKEHIAMYYLVEFSRKALEAWDVVRRLAQEGKVKDLKLTKKETVNEELRERISPYLTQVVLHIEKMSRVQQLAEEAVEKIFAEILSGNEMDIVLNVEVAEEYKQSSAGFPTLKMALHRAGLIRRTKRKKTGQGKI